MDLGIDKKPNEVLIRAYDDGRFMGSLKIRKLSGGLYVSSTTFDEEEWTENNTPKQGNPL